VARTSPRKRGDMKKKARSLPRPGEFWKKRGWWRTVYVARERDGRVLTYQAEISTYNHTIHRQRGKPARWQDAKRMAREYVQVAP
jgi:hypothetical protein